MRDTELDTILDEYDRDELELVILDGFKIYHAETDEKLWGWDAEFDGSPYSAMETLFARCGLTDE